MTLFQCSVATVWGQGDIIEKSGTEARHDTKACAHLCVAAAGEGVTKDSAGWGDLLAPAYRRTVLIGCTLFVLQQCSGINAIVYFSSSVFKQVGSRGKGGGGRVEW